MLNPQCLLCLVLTEISDMHHTTQHCWCLYFNRDFCLFHGKSVNIHIQNLSYIADRIDFCILSICNYQYYHHNYYHYYRTSPHALPSWIEPLSPCNHRGSIYNSPLTRMSARKRQFSFHLYLIWSMNKV